jgi:hypothetical protein
MAIRHVLNRIPTDETRQEARREMSLQVVLAWLLDTLSVLWHSFIPRWNDVADSTSLAGLLSSFFLVELLWPNFITKS